MRWLAADTDLWTDTTWIVDSTPVECGRSRLTVKRSEPAGWAKYGFCRSHSHWFWGLRLHLACTRAGLPIAWALADPKVDERQVLMAICDHEPHLLADRPGLLIIAGKGYVSRELDHYLTERGVRLIGPPTATASLTPVNPCSSPSASSSNRSTTPSKANSTSNNAARSAENWSKPISTP
nr:transposase [Amycolatopsis lexingtonensis]